MNQTSDWSGKRVLVTGAGTGIGKGIGLEFAERGADVAFHHVNDIEDDLPPKLKAFEESGRKVGTFFADFNDLGQTRQLGKDACEFLGGIDVLVNNAGITAMQPITEVKPHHYEVLYNVNVRPVYFVTQSVLPAMFEQGKGSIINLSSLIAFESSRESAIYSGTKGAVMSITRALAVELGGRKALKEDLVRGAQRIAQLGVAHALGLAQPLRAAAFAAGTRTRALISSMACTFWQLLNQLEAMPLRTMATGLV